MGKTKKTRVFFVLKGTISQVKQNFVGFLNYRRFALSKTETYVCSGCGSEHTPCEFTGPNYASVTPVICPHGISVNLSRCNWQRKPLKTAVSAKTSLNKRSAAPKTTPKSAKRRLRTA